MFMNLHGQRLYVYTAGHAWAADKPTVVFIHGVLNDHSVWILQSRHLAYNGWNVLALDLPGHGKSEGQPPATVEAAAEQIIALLDAVGVASAVLVGHSLGSLIALEAAARAPARINALAMLGTAFPMRVAPALLEAALNTPEQAIHTVNVFSHSTLNPPPTALGPGTWLYGASRALMRRVLASNTEVNLFHAGFKACDRYTGGERAMAALHCPALFILGRHDRMTPVQSGRALAASGHDPQIVEVDAGHAMMLEAPDEVLLALRAFLVACSAATA